MIKQRGKKGNYQYKKSRKEELGITSSKKEEGKAGSLFILPTSYLQLPPNSSFLICRRAIPNTILVKVKLPKLTRSCG
jgi:hypothetical protein